MQEKNSSKKLLVISAAVGIIGFIGGLLFLSPSLTGNVVGAGESAGSVLGIVLLAFGLVGSIYWFLNKK
jgi:hypothetical protein